MTDYRETYWQYISAGKLCLQFCPACEKYIFYPRALCPHCLQPELEWMEVTGRGTVYSYTIVHVSALPDFQNDTPYIYALVDLAEGVRIPSTLFDCPPNQVRVDLPVELAFMERRGKTLPVFKPSMAALPVTPPASPARGNNNK